MASDSEMPPLICVLGIPRAFVALKDGRPNGSQGVRKAPSRARTNALEPSAYAMPTQRMPGMPARAKSSSTLSRARTET